MHRNSFLLVLLGSASWLCYLAAFALGDLRRNTIGFVVVSLAAFVLYLTASALVLGRAADGTRNQLSGNRIVNFQLIIIVLFASLFRLTLLPTRPTLSDDMFRYIWDGRVQGHGMSPYQYPPKATELADLRRGDLTVWKYINRKEVVTVYPPGAQLAFAAIWRIVGDSVIGFKAVFVIAELLGGLVLVRLLQHFEHPPERILIYLWSPLLIFEVAHAGHIDGLMLPLLIAAFWARVKERHWLLGICLGLAAMIKLFPALLLPALLPVSQVGSLRQRYLPSFKTILGFCFVITACYLVYILRGASPLGFLPNYFNENFNLGLARFLFDLAGQIGVPKATLVNIVTFGGLAGLGLLFVIKPAASHRAALGRCIWLIGWFTLFTQNLFSWYLLWLLPLIVLFVEPGKVLGFKLSAAIAWLIFSGTIMLSYLFFIQWRVVGWGQVAEYAPLYALLLAAWVKQILGNPPLNWRNAFVSNSRQADSQ